MPHIFDRLLAIRSSGSLPDFSPPSRRESVGLPPAQADEMALCGPETFVRDIGLPLDETRTFTAPRAGREYRLRVQNGTENGLGYLLHRPLQLFNIRKETCISAVKQGRILVNGEEVISAAELRQAGAGIIEKGIALAEYNTLVVEIGDSRGSGFTVRINGGRS